MTARDPNARRMDTKPYVRHDPLIGYVYSPNTRLRLPKPGGGTYELAINDAGIRSDRSYEYHKPPGVKRVIVCGDSMAAGQFIENSQRFSEILERRVPHLEVINLALEGSGTDQQALLYEHLGLKYEHDLVMVLPFLQNIRRNMVDAREGLDPKTGARILRPKPRFDLVNGELVLKNVPVPETAPDASLVARTHESTPRWKLRLAGLARNDRLKKVLYALYPWEPFPEYRDKDSAEWRLMAALLLRIKDLAAGRKMLIVPTFYSSYVKYRMARNYLARFRSLATDDAIQVVDLVPSFRGLGSEAMRCFQEPHDMHFSSFGHVVIAEALQAELARVLR